MKAYTIVLTILVIALAYPARADDLSAAATAGAVAHLQKMQQLFPQAPAAAQTPPSKLPQYQTNFDDEGSIGTYQPNGAPSSQAPHFSRILAPTVEPALPVISRKTAGASARIARNSGLPPIRPTRCSG